MADTHNPIELDEMFVRLQQMVRDHPQFREEYLAALPVGYVDQMRAAMREVDDLTEASLRNPRKKDAAYDDIPDWVRLGFADTMVKWSSGKGSTCLHNPP